MNWIKKLFKRKTEVEKLQDKYDSLMEESYRLSRTNRTKSDEKTFEANEVLLEIKKLLELEMKSVSNQFNIFTLEEELYNKDRNL